MNTSEKDSITDVDRFFSSSTPTSRGKVNFYALVVCCGAFKRQCHKVWLAAKGDDKAVSQDLLMSYDLDDTGAPVCDVVVGASVDQRAQSVNKGT